MGQIGVDLLMSDSTNSGVEDFSISEKKVAQEILEITRKCNGRLIVATFASNVHRVSQILEAAVRCGRKVCIFGRSMENVVNLSRKSGNIRIADEHFLAPEQLNHTPANKICIVCTGSQGEPLAALSPHCQWHAPLDQADPGRYGRLLFFPDPGQRRKHQPRGE